MREARAEVMNVKIREKGEGRDEHLKNVREHIEKRDDVNEM